MDLFFVAHVFVDLLIFLCGAPHPPYFYNLTSWKRVAPFFRERDSHCIELSSGSVDVEARGVDDGTADLPI